MKAQVMMEYLTTYSWVILTVTIILGVILASGVFNPAGYNKDYCVGVPQLECYSIYSDFSPSAGTGNFRLNLRNNFGFEIRINRLELRDEKGNVLAASINMNNVKSGDEFVITSPLNSDNIDIGKLNRFELTIDYSPCSSTCSSSSYTVKKIIYTSPQKV